MYVDALYVLTLTVPSNKMFFYYLIFDGLEPAIDYTKVIKTTKYI